MKILQWIKREIFSKHDSAEYELIDCCDCKQVALAKSGGPIATDKGTNQSYGTIEGEWKYLAKNVSHMRTAINKQVDRRSIGLFGDDELHFLDNDFSAEKWKKVIALRQSQSHLTDMVAA